MELKIVAAIEEQIAVQFTGKLNILSKYNRQYLGHLTFEAGEIVKVSFQMQKGMKAFFQIIIQEFSLNSFVYVVEPEIVDSADRDVFVPYALLKDKLEEVLKLYQDSVKLRPPDNVKIIINPEFMAASQSISREEFEVLLTLTEWTTPFDVYQQCTLLDHEITFALVELRKKKALKILSS